MRGGISLDRLSRYIKAGYRIIGPNRHTGVEVCRWTKSRLRGSRNCYKSIYGIDSRRCIQMTPTLDLCNFECPWCWRPFGENRHKFQGREWDEPRVLVDEMIEAQRELLSGFGGNAKTSREAYLLAMRPAHVAISLDGEPTYYPHLPELIKEIKRRGMTVFLVTNGTVPHRLRELLEKDAIPTNLFISVYATNEVDYVKFTKSVVPDAFRRVLESLSMMGEFSERGCRTVFRMTVAKNLNMKDPSGYGELIRSSMPHFVEVKGYAWLGESRLRLPQTASPYYHELEAFAESVAGEANYVIKMRDRVSNIVVAARDEEVWRRNLEIAKEIAHLPGVPFIKR
ncbi:MAG: radical SAM protein [Aigarchaeota archaeon]|nr:radical SAM protein [Aigarchaeota archaeon]MDW8092924.1 radical SAM protein [Nitrososphaerota archaeon]